VIASFTCASSSTWRGRRDHHRAVRQILREPYFIPLGTPLLTQLQHFQEQQDRIGLVVDETAN